MIEPPPQADQRRQERRPDGIGDRAREGDGPERPGEAARERETARWMSIAMMGARMAQASAPSSGEGRKAQEETATAHGGELASGPAHTSVVNDPRFRPVWRFMLTAPAG